MQINFYADLRPPAGGKTVDLDVHAPITARQALESVTDSRPELAKKIWQSAGTLFEHIHVFVNGRQSVFLPPAKRANRPNRERWMGRGSVEDAAAGYGPFPREQ